EAEAGLRQALESIDLAGTPIPVFANATGQPYPTDSTSSRALLAGQLVRSVEFAAQVEAMHRLGARTFLEVGPDTKLTSLASAILEGSPFHALAVDASRGAAGNTVDLACSLASLAALGYTVDLNRWDEGDHGPGVASSGSGLTVKICGANARPRAGSSASPRSEALTTPYPPAMPAEIHADDDGLPERPEPFAVRAPVPRPGTPEQPPRITAAGGRGANLSSQFERCGNARIQRTMDPPDGTPTPHSNGQAGAHEQVPMPDAPSVESRVPAASSPAADRVNDSLAQALANTQENLVALQRFAEQTAALH